MSNKSLYKFISGKSKKPIAKVYAVNKGSEFQYYVFSKKSLLRAERRKTTISIRRYGNTI